MTRAAHLPRPLGYAKGRKKGIPAGALLDYKVYLPAHVASSALDEALLEVAASGQEPELLLLSHARCERLRGMMLHCPGIGAADSQIDRGLWRPSGDGKQRPREGERARPSARSRARGGRFGQTLRPPGDRVSHTNR